MKKVAVLVAMCVDQDGYRQVLGVCEGAKEDTESWRQFLRHLKKRGLKSVRLVTSDKCLGLVEALGEFYPEADWQRCMVHWYLPWGQVIAFGSNTYNDWRLPLVIDIGNDGCSLGFNGTDCGWNVDTSTGAMAHLWYDELGNLELNDTSGSGPQPGWGLNNTGPFQNMQASTYWTGTESTPSTSSA